MNIWDHNVKMQHEEAPINLGIKTHKYTRTYLRINRQGYPIISFRVVIAKNDWILIKYAKPYWQTYAPLIVEWCVNNGYSSVKLTDEIIYNGAEIE